MIGRRHWRSTFVEPIAAFVDWNLTAGNLPCRYQPALRIDHRNRSEQ